MDDEKLAKSVPNSALRSLDQLAGVWNIRGQTLDGPEGAIAGQVRIAWIAGGCFLEMRGEMEFMGERVQSLEIVGYDPETNTFPATVYSNIDGAPARYWWNVQENVVTHWTDGSKYTGSFGDDGTTLIGGWRPDPGKEGPENIAYDATMTRVESE